MLEMLSHIGALRFPLNGTKRPKPDQEKGSLKYVDRAVGLTCCRTLFQEFSNIQNQSLIPYLTSIRHQVTLVQPEYEE